MVGYPYTYGDDLTPEQANENRKQFLLGATAVISLYFAFKKAANAVEPGGPGAPAPAPGSVCPAPSPSPDRKVNILSGIAGAICANAITSGDWWLGFFCATIVIVGVEYVRNGK